MIFGGFSAAMEQQGRPPMPNLRLAGFPRLVNTSEARVILWLNGILCFCYGEKKFCWRCSCFTDASSHSFPPMQSFHAFQFCISKADYIGSVMVGGWDRQKHPSGGGVLVHRCVIEAWVSVPDLISTSEMRCQHGRRWHGWWTRLWECPEWLIVVEVCHRALVLLLEATRAGLIPL